VGTVDMSVPALLVQCRVARLSRLHTQAKLVPHSSGSAFRIEARTALAFAQAHNYEFG
jgi:hypothetical protein